MAREISGKILVEGKLVAQTPLAVGGAGAKGGVDLEVALDGQGRPYVPGTSLAGCFRTWIREHYPNGEAFVQSLFGYQESDKGHASHLFVEDAPVTIPPGLGHEVRSGLQIDRHTGTAREGFLFTREVLPAGSSLCLRMEMDLPKGEAEEACEFEKAISALLAQLQGVGLRLGGAKTRGLGRVQLEGELDFRKLDFSEHDHLFAWLQRKERETGEKLTPTFVQATNETLYIQIHWKTRSPVMVKANHDGLAADMVPLVSGQGSKGVAPVLPGSGIKGVLRSHAARILRTVRSTPVADNSKDSKDSKDPNPDPGLALVEELFGSTERAGRLLVDDVYCTKTVSPDGWFEENEGALNELTNHQDHVAIDRFTGGSSDSALYSVRALKPSLEWKPIVIELDGAFPLAATGHALKKDKIEVVSEADVKKAMLALLLLVLRDMQEGLVPLGFATRRGMGDIEITNLTLQGSFAEQTFPKDKASRSFPYGVDLEPLKNPWEALRAATRENETEKKPPATDGVTP